MTCIINAEPAKITSPTRGDSSLIDRQHFVDGEAITYTCGIEGIPTPTVTWYYNGELVFLDDVILSWNRLHITSPRVNHSGIYQCFVRNSIGKEIFDDQRTWILEVKNPSMYSSRPISRIFKRGVTCQHIRKLTPISDDHTPLI